MIIAKMLEFFINILAGMMHMIPSLDFDTSGFESLMATIKDVIRPAAYFLPLGDIAAVLTIFLAYQASGFLIWAINWVVRRIADIIP